MIIDRLLLYVFFGITFGGTVGILFSAPHVFESKYLPSDSIYLSLFSAVDQKERLKRLIELYKNGNV